jgi:hypothetical protein
VGVPLAYYLAVVRDMNVPGLWAVSQWVGGLPARVTTVEPGALRLLPGHRMPFIGAFVGLLNGHLQHCFAIRLSKRTFEPT